MANAHFVIPTPVNEPINSYAPGTKERATLEARVASMSMEVVDIPMVIGGKEVRTGRTGKVTKPHDHRHVLGHFHEGDESTTRAAIAAAGSAWNAWSEMAFEDRAAVFLKAADLLAGPWRATLNAATMLGQSKNAFQAEIDAACELADFLRFNVHFASQIYAEQPLSGPGMWNRLEYRPLEGFVLAISPFNFTAIGGNLPAAPALMGNTVVWKPASTAALAAHYTLALFREAGLPDGVINMVMGPGPEVGGPAVAHRDFAGLHFTGSTATFNHLWASIGNNLSNYRSYPRIVGETGGKDFVFAHPSADVRALSVALVRGAFEYQGQKCSAASRAFIPASLWPKVREEIAAMMSEMKMGGTEDFSNFVNAVIDEKSFRRIKGYIDAARASNDCEVILGGRCDDSKGWFVEPTVLLAKSPKYCTMCEEIFGPVLSVYVYEDAKIAETLKACDESAPYALTGAIFAQDRTALVAMAKALRHTAGNFYINDKPTGAVVGQQPFGGARASGTNDKAGSKLNLLRWVSPRTMKETFVPPKDWRYPFLG